MKQSKHLCGIDTKQKDLVVSTVADLKKAEKRRVDAFELWFGEDS